MTVIKKAIRLISIMLLIIIVALSFSSCDLQKSFDNMINQLLGTKGIKEDISLGFTEIEAEKVLYSPYYTPLEQNLAYSYLKTDTEKEIYDNILENIHFVYPEKEGTAHKSVYYKTKQFVLDEKIVDEAEVRIAIKAVEDDHPELFYINTSFGFKVDEDANYTAIQLYSSMSPAEISEKTRKLNGVINQFYKSIKKDLSEFQREKFVHDYLIKNVKYDDETAKDITLIASNSTAFNMYGTLVEKKAVCQGYAQTFSYLLNGLGVKTLNISGSSSDALHMWNVVCLDDEWYHIDTTFDDQKEEMFRYDYFNLNDEMISFDHEAIPAYTHFSFDEINGDEETEPVTLNMYVPNCHSREYNYYYKNFAHLTDYDGEAVTTALFVAASENKDYFQFYIDPDYLDYDEAITYLFIEPPQYFLSYIEKANSMLENCQIVTDSVAYREHKNINVVTTEIKYQ